MFKIGKYILLGVWLMLSIFVASAQTFDYATPSATAPVNDDVVPANDEVGQISSDVKVCPSFLPGFLSTNNFSVPITSSPEAGDQALNEFVWVVYGGTITAYEGVSLVEAIQTNEVTTGIHRSYVRIKGVDALGTHSRITVQWDEVDVPGAWVAVQQFSEWNCTEGKWSLFTNPVQNDPPTFSSFPANTILAWGQRLGYILPLPTHDDDDGCPDVSLLDQTWIVENPVGTTIASGGDDAVADHTADLQLGVNTVTWTVTDGVNTYSQSYTITVEPELHILNVAWINPSCAGGNGSVRVSNVTNDPLNPFSVSLTYSLYDDALGSWSTWLLDPYFGSLAAGKYQVKASLEYPSGHRQESEAYEFTLSAMAANAVLGNGIVGNIPSQGVLADVGDDELTIVPTDCGNGDEGQISMDPTKMVSQNSSIRLDGIDDYLLLNKSFTETVSEFSAAVWLKTTAISGTILSFNNSNYFQLELNDGRLQMAHNSTVAPNASFLVSNLTYRVNDGQWHLVLATYNTGTYKLYIDGVERAQKTVLGETAIGGAGLVAYGLIGATSRTTNINNPQIATGSSYFTGQLVEVGLWSKALSADEVRVVQRKGMTNVSGGLTDHWVLNSTPTIISSEVTEASTPVFSDAGNRIDPTTNRWARFVSQPSLVGADAPRLYSWEDDPGTGFVENLTALGYDRAKVNMSDPGLKTGKYRLTVSDILGCGAQSATYTISNGDDEPPYFLWNVSANKQAKQSSDAPNGDANQASDALFDTNSQTTITDADGAWWEVDLGNIYPISRVQLHPNGTLSEVYVISSINSFGSSSVLADDQAQGVYEYIAGTVADGQYVEFPGTNARYVRIRRGIGNAMLALNEVVVLTAYPDPELRKLYLTGAGDCEYEISANDAVIDPIAVDACGNAMKSLTYIAPDLSDRDLNTTLIDDDGLPLYTQFEATWTAIDENDQSKELKIRHEVVDEEKPVIHGNPFAGVDGTMSYCYAETFQFPIPNVTDNLDGCPSKYLQSITLFRNGLPVTLADADKINTVGYDHDAPGLLARIPDDMQPGTHIFEWRVVDYSGNETVSAPYSITIQKRPLLEEISYVPNSCPGVASDGAIYFSKLQSENDNIADPLLKLPITYRLTNVDDPDDYEESTTPIILTSALTLGKTYKASFAINGCRSNYNYQTITVTEPEAIALNELVSDVICWGDETGGIDLTPSGGSQTNILHLSGTESEVTANAYSALDLTDQGMIEAWVFLDDLNANGVNNMNAGIFGCLGSYGLKLSAGVPVFYLGDGTVFASGTAPLPVRQWVHLAGAWDVTAGTLTLYIDGVAGTPVPITGAPPTSGTVAIGSLGQAGAADNLMGFVRNARIWNAMPASDIFEVNRKLVTPIDNGNNVVANYPMNETSGAEVKNASNSAANGTASGAEGVDFKRQKFAYFWLKPDATFLTFNEDITNAGAGIYTVTLYDAAGCSDTFHPEIETDDQTAPSMDFFTTRDRTTTLNIGVPIVRYTNDPTASTNTTGDCNYVPYVGVDLPLVEDDPGEFDPDIKDGACNTDYVTLTYQLWDEGAGDWGAVVTTPLLNPAKHHVTMNGGTGLSGIVRAKWRAEDLSTKFTEREVTYYIVDNEVPAAMYIDEDNDGTAELNTTMVSVPTGDCEYQVPNGDFIPKITDNCPGTGTLTNDFNGLDNLDGEILPVGSYSIKWTYTDRQFPGIAEDPYNDESVYPNDIPYSFEFTHTLVVEDNTPPTAVCQAVPTLYLNSSSTATLNSIEMAANTTDDNCGSVSSLVLTRNVAYTLTSSGVQSSTVQDANLALDNNTSSATYALTGTEDNPWWRINLGVSNTVLGLNLYSGDGATLQNFWVVVANTATFGDLNTSGLWTPAGAVFNMANVSYAQYFAGTVSGSELVALNKVANGQYVWIVMDASSAQLCLAEVEVYGTPDLPNADKLTFSCADIRYVAGSFTPINVLLTAIDNEDNAGSCLGNVTIADNTPPTIVVAPTLSIPLSGNSGETINLNDAANIALIDGGSYDNCTPQAELQKWVTPATLLDCDYIGNQTVVYHVADAYGVASQRSILVTIDDIHPPVMDERFPVAPATFLELPIGPDGYYDVKVSDLITGWRDNCSDDDKIKFSINPARVFCASVGDFIDITITATDENGQTSKIDFFASEEKVKVVDRLGPTFSLSAYTHTIPSTGSAAIFFDDIVKDGNLHDNCTARENLLRYISYEENDDYQADEWCGYGSEGGGLTALSNLASKVSTYNGSSTALSGFPLSNLVDNKPATVLSADRTYYATNDISGQRSVQYNFAKKYEFERVEALWADVPSADGNSALSHNDTYMPSANITASGGAIANKANVRDGNVATSMTMETGTAATDAFWIQYTFSQPIMVANARLRWAAGSQLESNSIVQYYNGSTWETYGTIANNTDHSEIAIINATASITQLRLVYDPVAGTAPAIAEWYVYGQACTPYTVLEPIPDATPPGEFLISHNSNYLKAVTSSYTDKTNLSNVNDTEVDPPSSYYVSDDEYTWNWENWIVYEFYSPVTFTSTEVFWYDYATNSKPPGAARIRYSSDGVSWTTVNTIGTGANSYQTLSLAGIPATKWLMLNFEQDDDDQIQVANWRVYGHACETVNIPAPTVLSTNATYLQVSDITVTRNDANKGFLRDGNTTSNQYVDDTGSTSYSTTSTVQYSFRENIIVTSLSIDWYNQNNRIRNVNVQYSINGTDWTNFGAQFTPGNTANYTYPSSGNINVEARYVRMTYQSRRSGGGAGTPPGIYEFTINGYPVSGITYADCWETHSVQYFNCPASVTTQLPVVVPTTASVQYSSDNGTTWLPAAPISVTTGVFPSNVNTTSLLDAGNPVEANAIKLTFDNTTTEGSIGLYELRTFGRRIPQTGDETVDDACYTYDCLDIKPVSVVHLMAEDESGNSSGDVPVNVEVKSYFDIVQLEIKDCGYDGERYYALATGLDGVAVPYKYTWNEIQDYGQNLFADNSYNDITGLPNAAGYSTGSQPWVNFNTGGVATNTGYSVSLKLEDANSCSDSYNYVFDYNAGSTTATSVKEREACVNEEVTYEIEFPSKFAFCFEGTLESDWYKEDGVTPLATDANFQVVSGGNSNDLSVTGNFLTSTSSRGGTKTGIKYAYRIRQLDPYATITSTEVEVKDASTTGLTDWAIIITGDVLPGGPYWIPLTGVDGWNVYTTRYRVSALADGTRFIRTAETYDYGDYTACLETTMFRTTVYDVVTPVIEATRLVNKIPSAPYTFTGNPVTDQANFPICVRDTITYRVSNYVAADFKSLDWNFDSNETTPVPTGRRLAGGNSYDQTIQMVWDTYTTVPERLPRLVVKGFNKLGCTGTPALVQHTFNDNTPPVLKGDVAAADNDCSDLDVSHVNNPNQCSYMYINLPPPLMTDDCRDRIESYWCGLDENGDGDTDDTDDIANMGQNAGRSYPVGVHNVIWYARDYSGNVGSCTQKVTILDTEPPVMGTPPSDLEALVADVNCGHTYASDDHDVHPDDYCDANDAYIATHTFANIYRDIDGDGNYTDQDMTQVNLTTLKDARFDLGKSKVVWTADDGVDNNTDGTPDNVASVEFFVTVVDKMVPTVVDADGDNTNGIQLAVIVADTDTDRPGASFTVVDPTYSGTPTGNVIYYPGYTVVAGSASLTNPGNLLGDNCTLVPDLTVEFMSRSDKATDLTTEFPVGTTTITWRVSDKASPLPNRTTFTQDVVVSDKQKPELRADAEFVDHSISYCARLNYRIPIPRSYWDNVRVERLDYSIKNSGGTEIASGFILRSASPNFTIAGNAYFTYSFPSVDADAGADFTITWTATDGATPTVNVSDARTYTIHIEREPLMGGITEKGMSCGGAYDASIVIKLDELVFDDGPDNSYSPEFSIDNGANWTSSNSFTGLGNQTYTVMMRVNNCVSRASTWKTVTFTAPDAYKIRATGLNNICEEDAEGEVTAIMDQGGGAKGQWLFNGSNGFTVANYNELNITTSGAIEAWVYLDNLDNATIVQKGNATQGYEVSVTNSKFALRVGNSSVLESGYGIAAQRWYHVSAWWDATTMNIAVDGAANLTTANGSYDADTPAGGLTLGGAGFDGILRTVRIWDIPVTGAIASSAISPATPGLVGYWEISEGVGTTATSYDSYANNATAASASWVTNRPQPGFYTWTRNSVAHPLASNQSNIHLENLSKGRYEVTFIDPYNCPATGIKTFYNVLATDNALPVISFPVGRTLPLPVKADPGDCAYTFDGKVLTNDPYTNAPLPAITDVEYYTPTVADGNDCDYTITWQVIPVDGNATTYTKIVTDADPADNRINGMEVSRQGTNGSNRVRVTVAQNGMTLDPPFEYYIQVNDAEIPVAKGKTSDVSSMNLDNTPGGYGKVAYYAWQFDNGSTDNCTKTLDKMKPEFAYEDPVANPLTPWYTSVDLGCDAIGNSVQLYYRVFDEAGNESLPISSTSSFNVQDLHPPVFYSTMITLESQCATAYDGAKSASYTTFDPSTIVAALGADLRIEEGILANGWKDYTDNCEVKRIRYKLNHTTNASLSTNWIEGSTTDLKDDANVGDDGTTLNRFYVGTTEVVFGLSDKDNPGETDWVDKVMFRVIILPQPEPGKVAPSPGGSPGIN